MDDRIDDDESSSNSNNDKFDPLVLIPVGYTLFGVLLIIIALSAQLFSDLSNQLQLVNIIVSSLLSLILIGVYIDIANTSNEEASLQSDIVELQEKQSNLMKLQYLPRLRVMSFDTGAGYDVKLRLKNFGNGFADNLYLRTDLWFKINYEQIHMNDWDPPERAYYHRLCAGYTPLERSGMDTDYSSDQYTGGNLTSEEGTETFHGSVNVGVIETPSPVLKPNIKGQSLGEFLHILQSAEILEVEINLSVLYCDITGDIHSEQALGASLRIPETNFRKLEHSDSPPELSELLGIGNPVTNSRKSDIMERIDNDFRYPPE